MKDFFNLRKSKLLLFTLLAVFAGGVSPAWAETITVNEGTGTSQYIPVYGYYVDTQNTVSEFIIPSDRLADIDGATISGMTFYLSSPQTGAWGSAVFEVYLKEVTATEYTSATANIEGTNTVVYSGSLDGSQSTMAVTFSNSYAYGGGNLLVGFKVTTAGTYKGTYFYGESLSYGTNNAFHYGTSTQSGKDSFLPKVTFEYTAAAGAMSKPKNVTVSNVTASAATISWTAGGSETSWEISYSTETGEPTEDGSYTTVTSTSYNMTGLTAETTYYVYVRAIDGENHSKWSSVCSFTPGNLTINNVSTTTNSYVPIYGNYMDDHSRSQFVLPSTSISSMSGSQITKLVFYGTATSTAKFNNKTFDVYLKEVADATISSLADWSTLEQVYSGNLTVSEGKMTIVLDEGFDYSGGNLLVGINQTDDDSDYTSTSWTGVSATGASVGGYGTSISQQDFLPQMTFHFAPQTTTVRKPKNLAASEVATTTATLGWTNGSDETAWQIVYSTEADFNPDTEGTKVDVTANPYTLSGLTAATTYYAYVRAEKSGDYSAWSNKVEFTTLSAAPVITLSTTSHNFGLVSDADAQALTLTITNEGGAALTGLSVTPSTGFTVTDADGNALTATTIAASSSLVVKVKVSALGQQSGTITVSGDGIDAQAVTVSGYMLDDTKILETFASANSVSRWTVASGWTFNESTGAYSGTSSRVMTSPKLSVSTGDVLALNVKLGWSGGSLIVEGLDAEGNTVYDPVTYNSSNGGLNTSSYTLLTISDMPTTVAKVKLTGYYAYINVFNGFTYVNDPVLGLYSNEACTTTLASPATKNFGFATEAQSQLYYIKNTGNGQIDLTSSVVDGFAVNISDAALTENEVATLTVTMTATEGLHEGAITVTAKNHDDDAVLGTFVVNANGAVTGSKNNVVLSAFPAGWQNNNWTISNGAARNWSSTSSDLITTTLTVTEDENLLVEAYKYYDSESSQLSYSYSTDGGANWSDAVSLSSQLTTSYKIIAISGIPAGNILMKFTGTYVYIRQIYGFEAFAEPILEFAAEGTTKNFGMVTANTTSDAYTITNSGTAKLSNLSVTCDNSNFEIAVADGANEIAANGGTATFTVTLKNTVKGSQTGTVTISGDNVAAKTFTVKGYVADDTKIFTTFAALPDRWTNTGNYWSFSASGATATSSSSKLETPKITVAEGEKLAISAMQRYSGSSYYVTINGSSDNGATWTAYTKTLNNEQLNNTDYTVVELDDIPTTVNKLQFVGYYVYVNGLNGFTYDDNDPEFGVFSDAEFASQITSGAATNTWGFVSEDKTATYYIKNTGTGTMTLTKTDAPAGFTATLGATSLGTGESTTLTISMANNSETNEGYHAGSVVLTATDSNSTELGTFTVTSSGVVVGSKTDINFASLTEFPAGWEATNWSVSNGKATISYTSGDLKTGTYTVTAGESMIVEARRNSTSTYATIALTYSYSTDGGSTWSTAKAITPSSTNYELIAISDIPAGDAIIKFTGTYIDIQRIYGYTAVAKPAMTLSPAATTYDFGMQTANADYVITVTNTGTADMENLAAALTGDDKDDFEVAVSKTAVPYTGENTATITVTMKASTVYKTHNATLTISADGLANKEITLTGKTRDASKLFVDFDNVSTPATWDNEGWTVYTYGSDKYLYNSNYTTAYAVTTQALTVTEGESISFDVKAYSSYSSPYLTVRYSYNGGISWTDFATYAYDDGTLTTSFATKTISGLAAGTVVLQFVGTYCGIDNIIGFAPKTDEPTISVKKSSTAINNGATEAFGSIKEEATATYTIKNIGQGTLTITSPVTTTGVATAAVSATSLGSGESATLTITMPVAAPYEYKEGAVTVATSLGDFVINYNATVLNPNALDEQFASGKPAGWYFEGYWKVSGTQAMQEDTATPQDLITEQLSVAGTSDVLTFQAARTSSSSAPTFNVYTSQDRVTWTPVDLGDLTLTTSYQDVTISGLAAGDYYVKISGARVKVDNFLGWTKKNNTRDLYVTSSTFPASTDKGNSATISATLTSLIAAETGVYAKLFINDAAEATADAQDIALNGTKTFSFNYAIPENKTAQIKVYYSDDTEAFATAVNDMKVSYTLDETADNSSITAGTFNVKLTHTFVAGWNTVCLPFAVPVSTFNGASDDAVAYEFTGYNTTTKVLTFTKVTETLEAGKPYVIYTPDAINSEMTLTDVTVSATTAGASTSNSVTFQGTYTKVTFSNIAGDQYGLTAAGKIAKASASATMNGFRGYFTDVPAGARVAFVGDETDGIRTISVDTTAPEGTYDMQGRKVEQLNKGGLYIINGKKTVVK